MKLLKKKKRKSKSGAKIGEGESDIFHKISADKEGKANIVVFLTRRSALPAVPTDSQ